MKNNQDYKNIPGWGMDADPENEPTYPIKNWTGDDHNRTNYERSEQQQDTVEILISNERPAITRVYGNTAPPSGLSGMIRRYAFKNSEDRYRHWIPLILADRVNVIEGLVEDALHGHLPNMFKERGWKVEMQHNPKKMIAKLTIGSLLVTAGITWLIRRQK
ncbi:hypothetical protein [Mucilaginibacter sp. KACC 22063]|uniref:hypothetical protein n=1 Tax=Mucilaginibacter sp. KACC 22063 TaxID=3025666 RepID=UPI002365D867|nr:hypothetical protein [Mucilaginibacter sp. KACC 22063]WDF54211.1 hypothetical protein PQ461_14790 [Mucilaginibacter sp. KACC 22063]